MRCGSEEWKRGGSFKISPIQKMKKTTRGRLPSPGPSPGPGPRRADKTRRRVRATQTTLVKNTRSII